MAAAKVFVFFIEAVEPSLYNVPVNSKSDSYLVRTQITNNVIIATSQCLNIYQGTALTDSLRVSKLFQACTQMCAHKLAARHCLKNAWRSGAEKKYVWPC